jgi:hypothetical protein
LGSVAALAPVRHSSGLGIGQAHIARGHSRSITDLDARNQPRIALASRRRAMRPAEAAISS